MCDSDSGLSMSVNGNKKDNKENEIHFRINISESKSEKVYSFPPDILVSEAKNTIFKDSKIKLKDSSNYGLFLPPTNGKAGKFLQEERLLLDYPFNEAIGYLELKYKQRIYRSMSLNLSKLKKIHSKGNLKSFIEYVQNNNKENVNKFLQKGLDPNFQYRENGETPLTLAVRLKSPREMIMILVSGGAHLDYRSIDDLTPLHKASIIGNIESIKTLLDLGQSPATKDGKGFTPLYHAIISDAPAQCIERLLYDHSPIGIENDNGLQEIHQACRMGKVQHLEHLLSYGADINAQSSTSKDTPLHITALTNQINCARLLLFRGADRNLRNSSNQTPYQKSLLLGNHELGNLIKDYKDEDIVPIRISPKLNERRRSVNRSLARIAMPRSRSLSKMENTLTNNSSIWKNDNMSNNTITNGQMTNSASMNINDTLRSFQCNPQQYNSGSMRNLVNPMMNQPAISSYQQHQMNPTPYSAKFNVHGGYPQSSIISTQNEMNGQPSNLQSSRSYCNLVMNVGDSTSDGSSGAASYIQPVSSQMSAAQNRFANGQIQTGPYKANYPMNYQSTMMSQKMDQNRYSLSSSSHNSMMDIETLLPRMIVLQKSNRGFGFVIRGMKGYTNDFIPSADMPALQYLDQVEPESVAYRAGLRPGDFILEVNEMNVTSASHEYVVDLIRNSGEILALKVITIPNIDNPYGTKSKLPSYPVQHQSQQQAQLNYGSLMMNRQQQAHSQNQQMMNHQPQQQAQQQHGRLNTQEDHYSESVHENHYIIPQRNLMNENRLSTFSNKSFDTAVQYNSFSDDLEPNNSINESIVPKSYANQEAKLTQTLDRRVSKLKLPTLLSHEFSSSLIPDPSIGCESPAAIASLRVPIPVSMGTPKIDRYKHLIINSDSGISSNSINLRRNLHQQNSESALKHYRQHIDNNSRASTSSMSSNSSTTTDSGTSDIAEPPLPPPPIPSGSSSFSRSRNEQGSISGTKTLNKAIVSDSRNDFHKSLREHLPNKCSGKALAKRREKVEKMMEKEEIDEEPIINAENSFRVAAEKFHAKALSRQNNYPQTSSDSSRYRSESRINEVENKNNTSNDIPLLKNISYEKRARSQIAQEHNFA